MIIVYCNGDRHMLRPRIMPLHLDGKVINRCETQPSRLARTGRVISRDRARTTSARPH
jgi:hypothetical protein